MLVPVIAPAANAAPAGSCTTTTPALGAEVTCTASLSGLVITVPSGAATLTATVIGAGGGGASSRGTNLNGGNGGRGARVETVIDVAGLSQVLVDVPGGGLGNGSGAGSPGGDARIRSGSDTLVTAGGGLGGGWATCIASGTDGANGTGSTLPSRTISATVTTTGGAGGLGGTNASANGELGEPGRIILTFSANRPEATTTDAPAPAVRSFTWGGQGSGSTSAAFTEGTWQNTPSASEWTLPGHTLLGWATDPQFPVSIAQRATGAYDGVIDGRRMIFIPAGSPTFVSGDASLHAIWVPSTRVSLIGRC